MEKLTHQLLIMRHAKSALDSPSGSDFDRPLAPRGEKACVSMARYIIEQGLQPDAVVSSAAVRTRQTVAQLLEAAKLAPPCQFQDELYASSIQTWLKTIAEAEESVFRLLAIGHNPELAALVGKLAYQGEASKIDWGDAAKTNSGEARKANTGKTAQMLDREKPMPTAALAIINITSGWATFDDNTSLQEIVYPRELI